MNELIVAVCLAFDAIAAFYIGRIYESKLKEKSSRMDGPVCKGGVNEKPTTPPPVEPPKGQGGFKAMDIVGYAIMDGELFAVRDKLTQDQIVRVLLEHGNEKQKAEALEYLGLKKEGGQ